MHLRVLTVSKKYQYHIKYILEGLSSQKYMCVGTHSPLYYPLYLSNITFHWDMLEVGYARLSLL